MGPRGVPPWPPNQPQNGIEMVPKWIQTRSPNGFRMNPNCISERTRTEPNTVENDSKFHYKVIPYWIQKGKVFKLLFTYDKISIKIWEYEYHLFKALNQWMFNKWTFEIFQEVLYIPQPKCCISLNILLSHKKMSCSTQNKNWF